MGFKHCPATQPQLSLHGRPEATHMQYFLEHMFLWHLQRPAVLAHAPLGARGFFLGAGGSTVGGDRGGGVLTSFGSGETSYCRLPMLALESVSLHISRAVQGRPELLFVSVLASASAS